MSNESVEMNTKPTMIRIGSRTIGDGYPTYIIAEIGVNHNGLLELALELIDIAVRSGADAVKFQKRNIERIYGKKYLDNANAGEKSLRYLLPILQQVELPDGTRTTRSLNTAVKRASPSFARLSILRAPISSMNSACRHSKLLQRT